MGRVGEDGFGPGTAVDPFQLGDGLGVEQHRDAIPAHRRQIRLQIAQPHSGQLIHRHQQAMFGICVVHVITHEAGQDGGYHAANPLQFSEVVGDVDGGVFALPI